MPKIIDKLDRFLEHKNVPIIKKVKTFETDEGRFSVYDISSLDEIRRSSMFTVFEDSDGWIVIAAFVPDELQNQGIATDFYIEMNEKSKKKTSNPLKSTQPRVLSTGEEVHELSKEGIIFWDSLVNKGLAKKLGHKSYLFK